MALINLRNALMSGKRLPYDAEVEYLESTGTQYIPFEVPFYGIDITTSHVANNNSYGIAGAWNGGSRANSVKYTPTQSRGWTITNYLNSGNIFSGSLTQNAPTRVTVHGTSVTVNDASYTMGAAWEPGYNVRKFALFGCYNRGETVDPLSGRIYHCSLYDVNDDLTYDFIPVRKGTVGYLYDRVSGKLFGNAGTGDFIVGQDVVPVEYIESHGTECIDTGVVPTTTSILRTSIRLMEAKNTGCFVGALDGGAHRFHLTRTDFGLNGYFGYTNGNVEPFVDCNLELNAKEWYCKKDGVTTASTSAKVIPSVSVFLFARHYSSSYDRPVKARMGFCEILDNDLPVSSLRSVRVGTEGAMMDVLTRRIYRNAGTGAFGYGNDLKYPIPSE